MALRAQMRKPLSSPSPEALLSQLSGHNRGEAHSVDGGRSEGSRALGTFCHLFNHCSGLSCLFCLSFLCVTVMVVVL